MMEEISRFTPKVLLFIGEQVGIPFDFSNGKTYALDVGSPINSCYNFFFNKSKKLDL